MLGFKYALKFFKLVIIILNISYYLGMFWFIFCELTEELIIGGQEHFTKQFNIDDRKPVDQVITVVYWAFTTLSTVGFGDYNARSDFERIFCTLIFLVGVSIFSYIMGIFISIVKEISYFNAEIDDGDNLSYFFGVMKYYNGGRQIRQELRTDIEHFFEYKWKNDGLAAFDDNDEIKLMI